MKTNRRILVIDVGGTHVKVLVTGMKQPIIIPSGPTLIPGVMIRQVKDAVKSTVHMMSCRLATQDRWCTEGRCGNHITSEKDGWASIFARRWHDP